MYDNRFNNKRSQSQNQYFQKFRNILHALLGVFASAPCQQYSALHSVFSLKQSKQKRFKENNRLKSEALQLRDLLAEK
jgi:hypothetical protein